MRCPYWRRVPGSAATKHPRSYNGAASGRSPSPTHGSGDADAVNHCLASTPHKAGYSTATPKGWMGMTNQPCFPRSATQPLVSLHQPLTLIDQKLSGSPLLWNPLSLAACQAPSLFTFRKQLKTDVLAGF